MITTKYAKNDVSINGGEQNAFTIKANSKAFHTLISGLYADKIQSITREIWSNALDSHIAAGCPNIPFEVTFPSSFEPTFRVRDYGVGLAHKDVMGLYTTVFESTKENTNSQVGSFGLGSKSPFAYTDTFSVISVKNGEKNYYTALLNEDRIPTITHLHSEIVDEPNGVEVSFPVHKGDVHAFREAANKVSLGFNIKPIVNNDPNFKWPSDYSDHFYNGVYVKMGCVIYPVDIKVLKEAITSGNFDADGLEPEFIEQARSQTLNVFEVAIGSIEVSVSREALSYGRNEPTVPTLIKEFARYRKNIAKTLQKIIEGCATMRQAYVLLSRPDEVFSRDCGVDVTNDEKHIFRQWCPLIYSKYIDGRGRPYIGKAVLAKYHGKPIPINFGISLKIKGMFNEWYTTKKTTAIMPNIVSNEFISFAYNYRSNQKINFVLIDRNERRDGFKTVNSDTIKIRNAVQYITEIDKESNYDTASMVNYDPTVGRLVNSYTVFVEFWENNPDEKVRFLDTIEYLLDDSEYECVDLMSIEIPKKKRAVRTTREKLSIADKVAKYKVDIYSPTMDETGVFLGKYVKVENDWYNNYVEPENSVSPDYIKALYDSEHEFIIIPRYASSTDKSFYVKDFYDNFGMNFARFVAKAYQKNVIVIAQSYVKNLCEYYQNSITVESDDFDWSEYVALCQELTKRSVLNRKYARNFSQSYYNYEINSHFREECVKELKSETSVYKDYLQICIDTRDTSCYGVSHYEEQGISFTRRFFGKFPIEVQDDIRNALDADKVDTSDNSLIDKINKLKSIYDLVQKEYPIIGYLDSYPHNSGREASMEIAKYINLIDNSKGDKNAS